MVSLRQPFEPTVTRPACRALGTRLTAHSERRRSARRSGLCGCDGVTRHDQIARGHVQASLDLERLAGSASQEPFYAATVCAEPVRICCFAGSASQELLYA